MKGLRFYAEYTDKSKRVPDGNVVAVYIDTLHWSGGSQGGYEYECFSAVFYCPNSAVNYGSVSPDYLQEKCKRVSEAKARQIHPALFERLDYDPGEE